MSNTKHTPAQAEAALNANAHLSNAGLATYDDLLEALKLAYEHINGGPGIKAGAEFQAMWEQINTAISKAEGR